jgi:hypothetical protein
MADDIRKLLDESRAIKVPMEELFRQQGHAPESHSIFTKRPKSPQRMEDDYRTAYVLKRLNEQYPDGNVPGLPDLQRQMVRDYAKDPSQWESGYEQSSGSNPFYNGLQWSMSMPAAIYATGKMIGNEVHKALAEDEHAAKRVPYPEAYKDYEYATNTFTGGMTDAAGLLPKGQSYWHDVAGVREEQERLGRDRARYWLMPSNYDDALLADFRHQQMPQMEDGEHFLNRVTLPTDKVLNPTVAKYAGPLMDAMVSYPSSIGPATNAVLAGKGWHALAELAADYVPATAHMWIPATADYGKKAYQAASDWYMRRPPSSGGE